VKDEAVKKLFPFDKLYKLFPDLDWYLRNAPGSDPAGPPDRIMLAVAGPWKRVVRLGLDGYFGARIFRAKAVGPEEFAALADEIDREMGRDYPEEWKKLTEGK
jgi:hypothetical protein